MVSIGSKKPNAKEININFKKKHLVFGLILLLLVIIYYSFIVNDSPFLEKYVTCPNDSKQVLLYNNTQICGIPLPYQMDTDKQVEYYNNFHNNIIIKNDTR